MNFIYNYFQPLWGKDLLHTKEVNYGPLYLKLRHVDATFRQVVVAHDMTHKERQECKELVEQAKEKNDQESGNWVYKVRGSPGQMRIVRYRKTQ